MHRGYINYGDGPPFPFPLPDPISLGLSAATLASISTGASIAGGVTSAAGAVMGGIASNNAYSYKAAVAQNNAKIARSNADYALWEGGKNAERQGLADRMQMGKVVVGQAASGLDINSGTPLGVRAGQAAAASENQMMIRSNAARKAYGYEVEAGNQLSEARMDRAAGTNALTGAALGATGSLVGTASSVSDKWLKFGKEFPSGEF
jgi:hypothetical protein